MRKDLLRQHEIQQGWWHAGKAADKIAITKDEGITSEARRRARSGPTGILGVGGRGHGIAPDGSGDGLEWAHGRAGVGYTDSSGAHAQESGKSSRCAGATRLSLAPGDGAEYVDWMYVLRAAVCSRIEVELEIA